VVANPASASLLKDAVAAFRSATDFPIEAAALPPGIPGVGWSDHWAFWQAGYPAIMVTDTAPFRYPHYHSAEDTPDKLSYAAMARLFPGLQAIVRALSTP
jgi:hypothetical protein